MAYTYDLNGNVLLRTSGPVVIPQIIGQPQPQIVAPGDLASFIVVAADTRGLGYQWHFNANRILGATADTLLLRNPNATSEGAYSVVLTNSSGSVTSNPATLWWDSNGNGLADSWELTYFGNLNQRAEGDVDGDGVSNLQEFVDGTDPTNRTSFRSRLVVTSDSGGYVAVVPFQLNYDLADTVTLMATPYPPNSFQRWTGDTNSQDNPIELEMYTNKNVQARFVRAAPPAGMVAWWPAENNALDALGTNHGVLKNGVTFSSGKVGQSFTLDGVSQWVEIPDAPALRPASLTIEGWVQFAAADGVRVIFAKPLGSGTLDSFGVWLENGNLRATMSDPSGFGPFLSGPFSPTVGRWYYIAFSFDDATKQESLYLDGRVIASASTGRSIGYDAQPVLLGRDTENGIPSLFFAGNIDETSIYSRALSPAEIESIYLADVAGKNPAQPLITSPARLPDALAGIAYTQPITAVSGVSPISFSVSAGSLPNGLALSADGIINGVPTTVGSNVFGLRATDSAGVLSTELVCGLRILPAPPSGPAMPAGLVSWWRAENDALDAIGTNHGTLSNGVSFAAGEVGQAFLFNSANQEVKIFASPLLDVGKSNGLTIEAWIKPSDLVNQRPLAEWNDGSTWGTHFWMNVGFGGQGGPGCLYANLRDINLGDHFFFSPAGLLSTDSWQHIALTYDAGSGLARLFLNGMPVASANLGVFVPRTSTDLHLGYRAGWASYVGLLDEMAVYSRALNPNEVSAIYYAGPVGKVTTGPYINTAPTLPAAVLGQGYTQAMTSIGGASPVTYALSVGALPPGLNLSSADLISGIPTAVGTFSFTLTAIDASTATNSATFTIQVYAPVAPPPGIAGWWRGEGTPLDSVGTNHGVLRNGTSFAGGIVSQAFSLNGGGQSVDIADAPALRPSSITLEAWVRFNSLAGLQHVFAKPLGPGGLDSYGIWVNNGTLVGAISDANGFGPFLTAPFPPAFSAWHHVAYTFDDSTKQQALYLDGAQVAAGLANKSIAYDNQPFLLGHDIENGNPTFFFAGLIDEAAIYSRALGSNEIASIFNAGPAGKTTTGPYFITPSVLPFAVVSQAYTQNLATMRGTGPVTFAVTMGTLPQGLNLSAAGALSGTTTATGVFSFVVTAADAASLTDSQSFTLQVLPHVSPPAGIAGWWRAEGDTIDAIGGNDGLLVNNATFAPGKVGQAFYLNGFSDAVEIEDNAALRPASVTLGTWVMFLSTGPQAIMSKPLGNGGADSYVLWLENGNLNGNVADSASTGFPISVPFSPVPGQWYHLAFTFDDTSKQQVLYVNGAPVAFGLANLSIGYDPHPLFLGADVNNGSMNLFLQGRIDEAAIYSRALGGAEIAAIYSADAVGKTIDGPYFSTPPALPDAVYGVGYTQILASVRGTGNTTYALIGGALPTGLTLSAQGLLGGVPTNLLGVVPTNATLFNVSIRATDSAGLTGDQIFSLRVAAPALPAPGLISWWRGESSARDAIGTNHGVALNGTSYASGEVGRAFALDGINDCIQIADSPGLRPVSFTIECWVMFTANSGARTIFAKPLGGGTLDSFALWLENGYLRAGVCDTSGAGPILTASFFPALQQWYHLAYTFDDQTLQQILYLNNLTVAVGIGDRHIAYDANPVLLGCDSDNGNRTWFVQGRIDEAAIYSRALTASEIASIYYAGAAGRTTAVPYFVTSASLPDAVLAQGYTQTLATVLGTPPVNYILTGGALPPGLSLDPAGALTGVPTNAGIYSFTVRATEATSRFREQTFSVQVCAPVVAPAGLVGWWRGETNALDEFGSHHGTLQGNATYAPGRVGAAFNFDGLNSYVSLGTWSAGSNWTLEAWVNPSARPAGRRTIFGSLANCLDWALELIDGQLGAVVRQPGGCVVLLGSGVYPAPGSWYHIAATCDGTNASVYVNGVLGGTTAVQMNYIGDATGPRIGSSVCCGEFFPGLVDEVSVYNRALSPAEIASIYGAGSAGKVLTSPITLSAALQDGQLIISFGAIPTRTYTIQYRDSLTTGPWLTLTNLVANSTTLSFTNAAVSPQQRFFRIQATAN